MRSGEVSDVVSTLSLGVEDTKDSRRWWSGGGQSGRNDGVVKGVASAGGGANGSVGDGGEARSVLVRGRLREDVVYPTVGSEDLVELLLRDLKGPRSVLARRDQRVAYLRTLKLDADGIVGEAVHILHPRLALQEGRGQPGTSSAEARTHFDEESRRGSQLAHQGRELGHA